MIFNLIGGFGLILLLIPNPRMSLKPEFAEILRFMFDCYQNHGYKFALVHDDALGSETEQTLYVIPPQDLANVVRENTINRWINRFEDIPRAHYGDLAESLLHSV